MRSWLRPEVACFVMVWLLVLVVFQQRAFFDPGALWHVRVGEIILQQGFPTTDPFTYTFTGQTWIPQQWGGEIAMALAHKISGLDGMLLGFATLIAGLFTWLFSRLLAAGMSPILAAILVGACLFPGAFHYYIRPHMITIVGLAWVMACIVDYDQGRVSPWRLVGLIPVCILWTNIHAGVLGGILTLGLAVAWWSARFLLNRWRSATLEPTTPIQTWRQLFLLNGIVITCLLTPFVNPLGMEMLRTWQRIVGSSAMKEFVVEHMPLNLSRTPDQLVVGFAIFYGLFLLGVLLKDRREFRLVWLLPVVWFVLTFKGIRQGPLFIILGAVCLADFWPHTLWRDLLKKYGDTLVAEPVFSSPRWVLVPTLMVLATLGLQVAGATVPVVGRNWAKLPLPFVPTDLNEALRHELAQIDSGVKLFNDANLGGYMIYHFPEQKIFMDDRFELYGEQWLKDYVQMVMHEPERIEHYAQRYGFQLILMGSYDSEMTPLAEYLSSEQSAWQLVAKGVGASLYKRKPGA